MQYCSSSLRASYVPTPISHITSHTTYLVVNQAWGDRRLDSRDLVGGSLLSANRNLNVLLAKVHLSGKGAVGLPLARGAGSSLLKHLVDLLEGKTLGLRNEEVGKEDCRIISKL